MARRKTVSSKVAYKNPWFLVREDKMVRPDGSVGKYYFIERDPSVVVIPWEHNKIYLVNLYRYPIKETGWELPMGTKEPGISLLANAKKELREETGFSAKKWKKLGYFTWANGMSNQKAYVYLVTGLTKGVVEREADELDMKVKAFSLKQIDKMISDSKIFDDGTIAAIYQFKLFLKK